MRHLHVSACLVLVLLSGVASAQTAPNPVVVIETSMGTITVELFRDRAPATVDNFLSYAASGFYGGTIFHRVVRGFMIQGGGFTPQMRLKRTNPPIRNEATGQNRNERGTVAAARSDRPHSATSQFFINMEDNLSLNHKSIRPDEYGYAVFGRVVGGMDVAEKIERVKTNGRDVPQSLVMIMRVRLKDPS